MVSSLPSVDSDVRLSIANPAIAPLDVAYTGAVDCNTVSGKFSLIGFGDGTFKGIK